jgi:acetyl esterase/lipase
MLTKIYKIKLLGIPEPVLNDASLLEPVTDQPFRAVWVVKHSELQRRHSKVLIWLHGIFNSYLSYFPGGGYALGNVYMFLPVLLDLYKKLDHVSCPTSIFFLEYSLAPEAKYPTQLRQIAQAYQYLLDDLKIDPSNIIIGGDSAGGNLTLQLFRHITTPHPDVPITFPSSSRPSKCILVSPWVSLDHNSPAFTRNANHDVLTKPILMKWAFNWKGNHSDEFTDPLKAPHSSWKNILPLTLVVSGKRGMFIDDIVELCEKFKKVLLQLCESSNLFFLERM